MLWKKYEKFVAEISTANTPAPEDYTRLCRHLRVAPADLDEIICQELGLNGREVLLILSKFSSFAS